MGAFTESSAARNMIRWFWTAYLHDPNGHSLNGGVGDTPDGRGAREEVERRQPEEVRARIVRRSAS